MPLKGKNKKENKRKKSEDQVGPVGATVGTGSRPNGPLRTLPPNLDLDNGNVCVDDETSDLEEGKIVDGPVTAEQCWAFMSLIINKCAVPENTFKDVPLHSAMHGLYITISGNMCSNRKERIKERISEMGGNITASFTVNTNYLVASHGHTDKVNVARKRKVPVMKLGWVDAVWEACQLNPYIHGTQKQFMDKYTLPLFANMEIFVSKDMSKIDWINLKTSIEKNEGRVITDKVNPNTNVVVCRSCLDTCFVQASQHSIPVVSPAWVSCSTSQNILQEINGYRITVRDNGLPGDSGLSFNATLNHRPAVCPPSTLFANNDASYSSQGTIRGGHDQDRRMELPPDLNHTVMENCFGGQTLQNMRNEYEQEIAQAYESSSIPSGLVDEDTSYWSRFAGFLKHTRTEEMPMPGLTSAMDLLSDGWALDRSIASLDLEPGAEGGNHVEGAWKSNHH